jgi:hypothetical protein
MSLAQLIIDRDMILYITEVKVQFLSTRLLDKKKNGDLSLNLKSLNFFSQSNH